jgi:epimerase transport system membrane fusion protein
VDQDNKEQQGSDREKESLPVSKSEASKNSEYPDYAEAAFLDDDEPVDVEAADKLKADTSMAFPMKVGIFIIFIVFGVFGIWSVTAPLEGAAHASGTVTVKSHKKIVQHFEGGIVSEIHVKSGDKVSTGDVLIVLDSTQSASQLDILTSQFYSLKALESRLIAERDHRETVIFSDELPKDDPVAKSAMDAQKSIFEARKTTIEGSRQVLEQRIGQLESKITGLKAQQDAKRTLAESYGDEIQDYSELLKEGFTDKIRMRELERNHARLIGEIADLAANIAAAEIQIGETKLEIIQAEKEFLNTVVGELGETQTKIQDTRERLNAVRDVVTRTVVKSPASGIVNGFEVYTLGAVIAPGAAIAEIVPVEDALVIDAKLEVDDIDRVEIGQDAHIRFSAFSRRVVPTISAKVTSISADSFVDEQSGMAYYKVRLEVSPEGIKDLEGFDLVPGMPAEIFITTGSRTFMHYLVKPILDALARSMRED